MKKHAVHVYLKSFKAIWQSLKPLIAGGKVMAMTQWWAGIPKQGVGCQKKEITPW